MERIKKETGKNGKSGIIVRQMKNAKQDKQHQQDIFFLKVEMKIIHCYD